LNDTHFDDGSIITNITRPQLVKCLERYDHEQPQLTDLGRWGLDIMGILFRNMKQKMMDIRIGIVNMDLVVTNRIMAWMFYLIMLKVAQSL
jgi:hypothetical protein